MDCIFSFYCFHSQTEFSFFDVTPVGRILNRFSSDTNIIDDSLPFVLNILLAQLAGLIGMFNFKISEYIFQNNI